jgi:hypothetical protein
MKPHDLLAVIPAVTNGWTFAAFVLGIAVLLFLNRRP